MTTTEVGVLVAAYPAGILAAAIPPMMLVTRRGVRATTIVGLHRPWSSPPGTSRERSPWLIDAAAADPGGLRGGVRLGWRARLAHERTPAGRRAS